MLEAVAMFAINVIITLMKSARRYVLLVVAFACLLAIGATRQASATLYGRGGYGACSYKDCPQPPAPTVTTTPSGLKVAVNLMNGQSIPASGYTVTLTPLNGGGSTFKQADIYVNGSLAKTVTPDETGTARWQWVPAALGSANVKVVITDQDGNATTQEYTVNVTNQSTTGSSGGAPAAKPKASGGQSGLGSVLQQVSNGVQSAANAATRAVKTLPSPVVHSFPYVLFLLLGINGALLLAQVQREVHEYRVEQALLARVRQLNDSKKTFTELVSHYLRTPLSVIQGGVDLLGLKGPAPPSKPAIQSVVADMQDRVKPLILETQAAGQELSPVAVNVSAAPTPIWRQGGLLAPIALIVVVWLAFEYLVGRAGSFSVGQVEMISQAIVFTIVVVVFYLVFRSYKLHRHDVARLREIVANETAVSDAQDALIKNAVVALDGDTRKLDALAAKLGKDAAGQAIHDGNKRLQEMLAKFTVATQLHGISSTKPYVTLSLADMVASAQQQLQPKIDAKAAVLQTVKDGRFQVREPVLLQIVFTSLVDNAVAYSKDKGLVEIAASTSGDTLQVRITDHGVGIPEDKMPLLFQPFSKVEGAEVFDHEGMGFSLYLDRLILTYLGGDISVDSKPGHGTTVTIELPGSPDILHI